MKWRIPMECVINREIDHTISVTFETVMEEEPMGVYEYKCAVCDLEFSYSHSRYGGSTGRTSSNEVLDILFFCIAAHNNKDHELTHNTILGLCVMIRAVQNIDQWELIETPSLGSRKGEVYGHG